MLLNKSYNSQDSHHQVKNSVQFSWKWPLTLALALSKMRTKKKNGEEGQQFKIIVRNTSSESNCLSLQDWSYDSFSSVQFSRSVVSDSLWPHELQHARPPCPSPTPGVHSDSCPLSQRCHPAISSSGVPFSSCPQSLPASESFPMSQLFAWGGRTTGVSALASVLAKKSKGWSLSE